MKLSSHLWYNVLVSSPNKHNKFVMLAVKTTVFRDSRENKLVHNESSTLLIMCWVQTMTAFGIISN